MYLVCTIGYVVKQYGKISHHTSCVLGIVSFQRFVKQTLFFWNQNFMRFGLSFWNLKKCNTKRTQFFVFLCFCSTKCCKHNNTQLFCHLKSNKFAFLLHPIVYNPRQNLYYPIEVAFNARTCCILLRYLYCIFS